MTFSRSLTSALASLAPLLSIALFCMLPMAPAVAQDALAGLASGLPALTSTEFGDGTTSYSLSLQVLALMTALTVLPSLVLGMTCEVGQFVSSLDLGVAGQYLLDQGRTRSWQSNN